MRLPLSLLLFMVLLSACQKKETVFNSSQSQLPPDDESRYDTASHYRFAQRLSWKREPDVDVYHIQAGRDMNFDPKSIEFDLFVEDTFVVLNMFDLPEKEYFWRMQSGRNEQDE